jgi:hypothetical protein
LWAALEDMGSDQGKMDLKIKECLENAAFCERHAGEAINKVAKDTFAETAKAWRGCATSFAILKELKVD